MQYSFAKPVDDALLDRAVRYGVEKVAPSRAVAVCGPRRIGKTTLTRRITQGQPTSWYVGEFPGAVEALSFRTQGDLVNALTAGRIW